MAGRPTKYTPAVHAAIVDALADGLCKAHAAALAGIGARTLEDWLAAGESGEGPYVALALEVRHAEAEYARVRLKRIDRACGIGGKKSKGDGDWKAAAWLLEKRFPKVYGATARELAPPKPKDDRPFSPWKIPEPEPDGQRVQ